MTMPQTIPISAEKWELWTMLKKKSDADLRKSYKAAESICLYYENADSFEQSAYEANARKDAQKYKEEIREFVKKFRPELLGSM